MKTEYFDVLSENGEHTGVLKERSLVHRDGDWHGASRIWIVRRREACGFLKPEILLQRRSQEKDSYPGMWDAAVAGHLSAGEDYAEAAVRECAEEIGLKVTAQELRYLFELRSESRWQHGEESCTDREIIHVFALVRDVDISACSLQREEVGSLKWEDAGVLLAALRAGSINSCIRLKEYERLYPMLAEI